MYLPPNSLNRPLSHLIQRSSFQPSRLHRSLTFPPLLCHSLQYAGAVPPAILSTIVARIRKARRLDPRNLISSLENRCLIHAHLLQNLPFTRNHDFLRRRPLVLILQIPNEDPLDPLPPRPFLRRLFSLHSRPLAVENQRLVLVERQSRFFSLDGFDQALGVEGVLFGVEGGAFAAVVHDHVGQGDARYEYGDDCFEEAAGLARKLAEGIGEVPGESIRT